MVFRESGGQSQRIGASLRSGLRRLRDGRGVEIHERVDLRAWCRLRVGGTADLLIRCRTAVAVTEVLDLLASHGVGWLVIGDGSTLVLPDEGLRVPVLRLTGELSGFELDLDGVVAGGGASVEQVARAAARSGLAGMDARAETGTIGGGLVRESVSGGAQLRPRVQWIDVAHPGCKLRRLDRAALEGEGWPGAAETDRRVVLRARVSLRPDRLAAATSRTRVASARSRSAPGLGVPAFQDPPESTAAELIQRAGCSGLHVGGARLDGTDPNIVLTTRLTSAADVMRLSATLAQKVEESCGVRLVSRLQFVNSYGRRVAW